MLFKVNNKSFSSFGDCVEFVKTNCKHEAEKWELKSVTYWITLNDTDICSLEYTVKNNSLVMTPYTSWGNQLDKFYMSL